MAEKKYYWLKLKEDFFSNKEIKKLRKIAGGDTYTIIYLKIQLLSLKNNGVIIFDGIEDSIDKEIALVLDEEIENVRITMTYLNMHNLIEQISDYQYLLPKVVECTGSEGSSAERVRRHRENKLLLGNGIVTANVTCNTEKREKRKEKREEKKEEKKKITASPFADLINAYTTNQELIDAINGFVDMRKGLPKGKQLVTERAFKMMLNKLDKLGSTDETKISILDESILNCWTDVWPLKEGQAVQQPSTAKKPVFTASDKDREEYLRMYGGAIT